MELSSPIDFNQPEEIPAIHLTAKEILTCRTQLRDILIAPFDESKCKGVGYNISPSELCYSVRKKRLLQIHRTAQEVYVWIPPHDTILTLSHEYLQVSSHIAGCFLSRLRPITKGLGNVSTTLDPCWKGMLLLSINNPSSRRVKLVISQLKDDQFSPTAVITMLLWKIAYPKDEGEGILTFRLDNPAMRTDIWAELIAEPYRFFRGRHYRHFRDLIQALINYQPSADQQPWIAELQDKLEQLENAVRAVPRQFNQIRALLLRIHHLECESMPAEVINKLHALYSMGDTHASQWPADSFEGFQSAVERILASLSQEDEQKNQEATERFVRCIYQLYQECNYQRLCGQVSEIHSIIRKHVQYRWKLDGWKRFWFHILRPHLSALVATILLVIILAVGQLGGGSAFYTGVAISVVPILVSFFLDHKRD